MTPCEWVEQPLDEEQREANRLWMMMVQPAAGDSRSRDRWGSTPSHVDPTPGDQWFDRETGRAWVYRAASGPRGTVTG